MIGMITKHPIHSATVKKMERLVDDLCAMPGAASRPAHTFGYSQAFSAGNGLLASPANFV